MRRAYNVGAVATLCATCTGSTRWCSTRWAFPTRRAPTRRCATNVLRPSKPRMEARRRPVAHPCRHGRRRSPTRARSPTTGGQARGRTRAAPAAAKRTSTLPTLTASVRRGSIRCRLPWPNGPPRCPFGAAPVGAPSVRHRDSALSWASTAVRPAIRAASRSSPRTCCSTGTLRRTHTADAHASWRGRRGAGTGWG